MNPSSDTSNEKLESASEQERKWAADIMRANMALYLVESPMRADIDAGLKAALEWAASRSPRRSPPDNVVGLVETLQRAAAFAREQRNSYVRIGWTVADEAADALLALSTQEGGVERAGQRLREKLGAGEFYAQGDRFELVFRPGGGNFAGADAVVAKMACGETAYWLPGLIATLLNTALKDTDHAG